MKFLHSQVAIGSKQHRGVRLPPRRQKEAKDLCHKAKMQHDTQAFNLIQIKYALPVSSVLSPIGNMQPHPRCKRPQLLTA